MAGTRGKKQIEAPVVEYGFVLAHDGPPMHRLRYVLARFTGARGKWRVWMVGPDQRSFRYYPYLFVASVLALRWAMRHDSLAAPGPFAVMPQDEKYGGIARYLSDVEHQVAQDGTPRRYHDIPAELRRGMWAVFSIVRRKSSDRHARLVLRSAFQTNSLFFWKLGDFPEGLLHQASASESLLTQSQLPQTGVSINDVIDLQEQVCTTAIWGEWQRPRAKALPADKQSSLLDRVCAFLADEARVALAKLLHNGADSFVPLRLQRGQPVPEEEPSAMPRRERSLPQDLDRCWVSCDRSVLLPPAANYFLSAISGAGKTVFLRQLQIDLLRTEAVLPLYLSAKDLSILGDFRWEDVRSMLAAQLGAVAGKRHLASCLDDALSGERVVFLVDAMDNLAEPGMQCIALARQSIAMARQNAVVLAGRPTAARWLVDLPGLSVLRLCSFDRDDRSVFFGDALPKAIDLCRRRDDLLAVPMYAHLVKQLVLSSASDRVTSRWSLYSRFLQHALFKHPSNMQQRNHDEWARSVENMLGRSAYHAIDASPPAWGVVPASALDGPSAGPQVPIDMLPAAGIVDVFELSDSPGELCLVFSHQSMQEYLAARWVSRNHELTNHVLSECWNPKWHQVITFLAGKLGESLVEALLRLAAAEDPVHGCFWLAAECAGETPIPAGLEDRLVSSLAKLTSDGRFAHEAVAGLVAMRTAGSHEAAWRALVFPDAATRLRADGIDSEVLLPLYTPERAAWLLTHCHDCLYATNPGITTAYPFPGNTTVSDHFERFDTVAEIVIQLLCAWSDMLPHDDLVEVLRGRILRQAGGGWMNPALVARLDSDARMRYYDKLVSEDHRSLKTLFIIAGSAISIGGGTPTDSEVAALFRRVPDDAAILEELCAINHMAPWLHDEHIERIVGLWRQGTLSDRLQVMARAPNVCARCPDLIVTEIVAALGDHDSDTRMAAMTAAKSCGSRLQPAHWKTILSFMDNRETAANATVVFVAHAPRVDSSVAQRILDMMDDDERHIRMAAMGGMPRFQVLASPEHWAMLKRNLIRATEQARAGGPEARESDKERRCALRTIAGIDAGRVPPSLVQYVVESYDLGDGWQGSVVRGLARHLDQSQTHLVIERIWAEMTNWTPGRSHLTVECLAGLVEIGRLSQTDRRRVLDIMASEYGRALPEIVQLAKKIWSTGMTWQSST